MALTKDDLNAIAQLLQPINDRLDKIEDRLDQMDTRLDQMDDRFDKIELRHSHTEKKLEDLQLNVAIAHKEIKRDLHELQDKMDTVIEILKLNELLPR